MAFTNDQLSALETAIAQGALSVQYADRRVTYHTMDEMLRLRNQMRSELGLNTSSSANRGGKILFVTSKGL
jgi:hypothetical protein